ncbi:MAG: hypothetical protein P8Y76_05570 [bacterium]
MPGRSAVDAVPVHGARQVFDRLLALVVERRRNAATDRALDRIGDRDTARLGQRLQARRNVYTIAIDRMVGLLDDVAEMNTDAKLQAMFLRRFASERGERILDRKRCTNRADDRFENREHRVARGVDDAPARGFDLFAELRARRIERGHSGMLVRRHEARIAGRIRS